MRIPAGIIGAVQNAAELMSVFAENGIESAAAFRPQDLVLMMFTRRGDVIGENDPAFQKIKAPEELDTAKREKYSTPGVVCAVQVKRTRSGEPILGLPKCVENEHRIRQCRTVIAAPTVHREKRSCQAKLSIMLDTIR